MKEEKISELVGEMIKLRDELVVEKEGKRRL